MDLTQSQADLLHTLEKYPATAVELKLPLNGQTVILDLVSNDGRTRFKLDLYRSKRDVSKANFTLRFQNTYHIRRLDLLGNHENPPGPAPDVIFEGYEEREFLKEDHMHFYAEGYGSKWALPLAVVPGLKIDGEDSLFEKLLKFLDYCNVKNVTIKQLPLH